MILDTSTNAVLNLRIFLRMQSLLTVLDSIFNEPHIRRKTPISYSRLTHSYCEMDASTLYCTPITCSTILYSIRQTSIFGYLKDNWSFFVHWKYDVYCIRSLPWFYAWYRKVVLSDEVCWMGLPVIRSQPFQLFRFHVMRTLGFLILGMEFTTGIVIALVN